MKQVSRLFGALTICVQLASCFLGTEILCPAPKPCRCHDNIIDCRDKDLQNITEFNYTRNVDTFTELDVGANHISSLLWSAFSSLSLSVLLLDNNNISTVHHMAFHGHEKQLIKLNLANNNLRVLPIAIGRLRVLKFLDISGNPILITSATPGLTDPVMVDIGDSIEEFSFGHKLSIKEWPRSLRHLQQLTTLKIIGSNIDLLYQGSFYGFTDTLKSLTIQHAQLKQVPIAIGQLRHIEELHIDYSETDLGDKLLVKEPFQEVSSTVKVLTLRFNKLRHFPVVIKYLTQLQNLSLEGNNFTYISDESVEDLKHTNVSILDLKLCGLKRIPASISELSTLVELDLSYNEIVTIEYQDIEDLLSLRNVSLKGNPLRYISRDAFSGLDNLEYLDLSDTKLTSISEGLQNLRNLKWLDLTNTSMDCTCDMVWVKYWFDSYLDNLRIHGVCETIDSLVQVYLNVRIPRCPEYF